MKLFYAFLVGFAGAVVCDMLLLLTLILPMQRQAQESVEVSSSRINRENVPHSLLFRDTLAVVSYDSIAHHSKQYYSHLARIVQKELGLEDSTVLMPVRLIFVNDKQYDALQSHNRSRWGVDWVGYYLHPCVILIRGNSEQDDTFMHEYLHLLQQNNKIFKTVPDSLIHKMVYIDEGLLLASRSYLEFVKEQKEELSNEKVIVTGITAPIFLH